MRPVHAGVTGVAVDSQSSVGYRRLSATRAVAGRGRLCIGQTETYDSSATNRRLDTTVCRASQQHHDRSAVLLARTSRK